MFFYKNKTEYLLRENIFLERNMVIVIKIKSKLLFT